MKICAACCNELPQSSFSKKQWKLKQYERRCTDCINANKELQLKPPPKTINKEEDKPTCYICLDDGLDELGGEVMRNCSCRGSAGYVHLSCAVKYAEQKFKTLKEEDDDPWKVCPNCHQRYTGEIAIDLAKKYVPFVEKNYPYNHTMILGAQVGRLESLTHNNHWNRGPDETREAEQVANNIIHKIRKMKLKRISISHDDRIYEAYAYEILGCMIVEDGEIEKFPEAIKFLEKSLEVSTANNYSFGITRAKGMIAMTKTKMEQGDANGNSSLLQQSEQMYKQAVKLSSKPTGTIIAGLGYIEALKIHHHGVKAERILLELYNIALRNHGADHDVTKDIDYQSNIYRCRAVSVASDSSRALSFKEYIGASHFRFICYDDSFERCIIKDGPNFSDTTKSFSLSTDDIIFALGTPVICHGTNSDIAGDFGDRIYCEETDTYTIRNLIGENGVPRLGDIRSWNNETQCYTIHWEDESFEPSVVHRSKVIVLSHFGNDHIVIPIQAEVYLHTTE